MSKKTNTIASALIVALFLILLNLLVWFRVIGEYTSQVLTIAGINAIIALGLNLISGFTGQLALGHAGFMAVGAYTTAALLMKVNLPMALAVLGGALMSALFGFLIGLPTLRLRGDYLAIVTLGFGEIIRVLMINLPELTGGPAGLKGIPTYTTNFAWRPVIPFALVYLALTLVVVLLNNLLNSSHGAAIVSIREDEIAANAMGVNVFYYKLFAFTLSAFIGGLGGALYAPFFGYLSPNMFNFQKSVEFLIIVVLGGMGNLTGTVVAGIGLTYLQEILRFLKDYRLVIYPVILIIVMLFQPSGIMGLFGNKEFSLTRLVSKMLGEKPLGGEESSDKAGEVQ
ncbi:MAG: branched-chain amino acid ABC transporter permease [Firmicutes bacterium]|nr:branched-chain amino acid ABC transporter permease [Bacillota bacterium]